ncbi:MAG: SDR family NAD(P)-dependent oxidoreductase, partial [Chloroflexi bacterium]|nr:SDR family NAD(P)-dependent oxidoreductase [Chloroflexota bacterium]
MNKKVCIVTGGSQGIGKETALELARLGASVVVVCRDRGRGETAVSEIKSQTGNQSVDLMLVDLSSQTQIRQFAIEFAAKYSRLDVLINNAGIIPRERQLSEDGIEMTFAVNHLAPFLLTNLLLPMMKATKDGRIITVASQVHSSQLDFDNLQSEKRFHKLEPYMQSKLANILFTLELARRLQGSGLTANCLHPGVIRTGLLDDFDYMHNSNGATATKHGKRLSQPVATGGASAAEGAKMSIYLATSEDVANITGVYFQNGKQAKARDIAYDKAVAEKLWQVSLEMSGWREDSATPPDIENQEEPDLEEEDEEIYTFPVSFAQQRLWFVDQLDPGKAVYNIPYHHQTRWKGALNVPALEYALVELVARHEPLRTTFMVDDGEPVQVIRAKVNTSLPVIDLTHLQADEQAAEVDRIINEEARHTFDLGEGPLFYAKLLKLAEDDHVFIFMVHHITVDASSLDIMAEELAAFYEAFIAGKEADIPELPLQYADFVIWQREWMQGNVEKEQLDYWKKQLGGQLPVLELPTDRPRPKRQQNNGSWEWFRMPPALGQQIRDFSRGRGVSLYMTMLAGFKALMHRYSGQDEIIVSSPTANRTQPELEKLIAFFINPVVLRSSFADNPTFGDYLKTVRKIAMGAFAHQELPFD